MKKSSSHVSFSTSKAIPYGRNSGEASAAPRF